MNILEVRGLEKSYPDPESDKNLKAVDGISFTLEEVQIYGILGPNGAGKTTTLEMIEGLTDIDKGYAAVNGINVADNPYAVKEIIGVQLQSNEYFDSLSLKELLVLFGKLYQNNVDPKDLLNKVDLLEKINSKPEELSGGQKQRFSIACALVNEPKVLFLDEPTTGLDPQAKHNLWELIKELNPRTAVEALTPDFKGLSSSIDTIVNCGLEVFAQNIETVERLTHQVRDIRAGYQQTLDVLAEAKKINPKVLTKTSIILGLGETEAEIKTTMDDLITNNVDILTIGQYLRPTVNHHPVARWVTPAEFERYRDIGLQKGFLEVVSGPMVRSSYRAERALEKNNAGL